MSDIQRMLARLGYDVTADGIFGRKTEAAVKAFQQSRKLTVDGIVGTMTMTHLLAASVSSSSAKADDKPEIVSNTINTHITYFEGRRPKYIAIHYTAGSSSKKGSAMATRSVFLQRRASADYVVDDEEIVQINPNVGSYYCWAVGDGKNIGSGGGSLYRKATNRNTISIEICSNLMAGTTAAVPNHSGWFFTDKALDNALRLVRYLMKVYDIKKENVVRHYDITGKLCPGVIGWNDGMEYTTKGRLTKERSNSTEWEAFWKKI